MTHPISLDRRAFLGGGAALAAAAGPQPAWARSVSHGVAAKAQGTLSGEDIRLGAADALDELAKHTKAHLRYENDTGSIEPLAA